jgi:hypothetical protein
VITLLDGSVTPKNPVGLGDGGHLPNPLGNMGICGLPVPQGWGRRIRRRGGHGWTIN